MLSYSLFSHLTLLPLRISLPHALLGGQGRGRNIGQLQTAYPASCRKYTQLFVWTYTFFLLFQGFDLRNSCLLLHEIHISSAATPIHRDYSILLLRNSVKSDILCVRRVVGSIFHQWKLNWISTFRHYIFVKVSSVNNFFMFTPLLYNWFIVII